VKAFDLSIAGICIRFWGRDQRFLESLSACYQTFANGPAPAAVIEVAAIRCKLPCSPNPGRKITIDEGNLFAFKYGDSIRSEHRGDAARLSIIPDRKIFDVAIRILYSRLLPRHNGMLVHSAGIASGKRGFLFYGPSSAGKSTVSMISNEIGKQVLSDELCAVRKTRGKFRVYATPFKGEYTGAMISKGLPLTAMLRLDKSTHDRISLLTPEAATMTIMRNVFTFENDAASSSLLLDLTADCVTSVPQARLEFSKSPKFWQKVEAQWN
jgi:hypothetical protein